MPVLPSEAVLVLPDVDSEETRSCELVMYPARAMAVNRMRQSSAGSCQVDCEPALLFAVPDESSGVNTLAYNNNNTLGHTLERMYVTRVYALC